MPASSTPLHHNASQTTRAVPRLRCSQCQLVAATVLCHGCGALKVARCVASFAHELDEGLQVEPRAAA